MNEEIKKEIEGLIGRAFRDREREGSFDMEELEAERLASGRLGDR